MHARPGALVAAINGAGVLLASMPPEVTYLVLKHCPFVHPPHLLSPVFLRAHILRNRTAVAAACARRPRYAHALLDYCLSVGSPGCLAH